MAKYQRQGSRKKKNGKIWVVLALIVLLLAAIAVAVFGFVLPYQNARNSMPSNGELLIQQQADGLLVLSWPEADRADYYCIELLLPASDAESEPELVYKDFAYDGTSCSLPELPQDRELILRVRSVVEYRTLVDNRIRFGETSLEVITTFNIPTVADLQWTADTDAKTITGTFIMQKGDKARVYLLDDAGGREELKTLDDGTFEITFGENGDVQIPGFGAHTRLGFDAYREEEGLEFYGNLCADITIVRDDLLGRNLNLQIVDEGDNVCTLTWNETKGEHYEVQMMDDNTKQWVTIYEVAGDGQRTYTSGHLPIFREFHYRIVAVGGQTIEDSEYAAISEDLTFTTKESPIYATIWPTNNLVAYKDSQKTEEAGKVEVGKAYCVLEEKDGMFGVRLDGQTVYIDSNYCMINLPEYVGDLCRYQITNSYSSIYMVHEFEIPKVTDVITAGYEHVKLSDGSYLVPLLYPTAKKLVAAAQSAIEQGYRLKIYDAFRPNKATKEIYDLTNKILDNEIPGKTFTGVKISSLKLPEPQVVEPAEGETLPEGVEPEKILTYRMVMCGDRYNLGYFLARGGSLHNLGIAVDLTLEDLSTGNEISMQTSMHDLSQYSVLSRNNTAANALAGIMKGAGFGDLVSEWWHFQDNEARSELSPPTVYAGVTASCWMADDNGWRYRRQNGSYYAGETVTIDGVDYTFDDNGYVVEN